ncbi:MAG: response regulator transcription factor, partial [Bacilli bacterium]
MKSILIVEDDSMISQLLEETLLACGYEVKCAFSGTEARLLLQLETFHCVLLDLMLPGCSGDVLLKEIRNNNQIPVIVISAKSDTQTKIELLRLGADDFIAKPFHIHEVEAR